MTSLLHGGLRRWRAVSQRPLAAVPGPSFRSGARPACSPGRVGVLPGAAAASLLDVVPEPAIGRVTLCGELNAGGAPGEIGAPRESLARSRARDRACAQLTAGTR